MSEEDADLTSDQTDILLHFQDLTGIEDIGRCRQLLQTHNWDMEAAVHSRFSEPDDHVQTHNSIANDTRMPSLDLHPIDQRVYTVAHQRPRGFFAWSYWIATLPFQYFYSRIVSLFRFAYRLLHTDPRTINSDPQSDVRQFVRLFTEKYGRTCPAFYDGAYAQALNEAKRDLKFMLVYLHGPDHEDTDTFCTNVFCSPPVVKFVNESFLTWGCSTSIPEGYRVSQILRENTYPFLSVIVPRQNRMTVVARMEGAIGDGVELIERLRQVVRVNEHCLVAARMERDERNFNQTLRQQQDEAYQESLKADKEKELVKRQEKARLEEQERAELDKLATQQQMLEELERKKERMRDELPEEPDSTDPDVIKILLKLPNGIRLERRFRNTDSVQHLHNYVFVHEATPDNFRIVQNFPKRIIDCTPLDGATEAPSFRDLGLDKSELLFVQDDDA